MWQTGPNIRERQEPTISPKNTSTGERNRLLSRNRNKFPCVFFYITVHNGSLLNDPEDSSTVFRIHNVLPKILLCCVKTPLSNLIHGQLIRRVICTQDDKLFAFSCPKFHSLENPRVRVDHLCSLPVYSLHVRCCLEFHKLRVL